MVSSFINPVVNPDAKLGTNAFAGTAPVALELGASESDFEIVIRAIYKQVLGNAHIMESEHLSVPESQLRNGDITIREFVRAVALSDLYRSRFFENCSRTRSIELNFKHLLGRAPESYEELSLHGQYLDQGGFVTEIESYLDSEEYLQAFGDDTVPYYRGYKTQTGRNIVGFTHMLTLLRGSASSDQDLRGGNRSRLNRSLMGNRPSAFIPVVGTSLPYQRSIARTVAGTDTNRLVARALGIKFELPDASFRIPTPPEDPSLKGSFDIERQKQFYNAYHPFKETAAVEFLPGSSDSDAEVVIRAVYRQVLGNAHIMESERLDTIESQFKQGDLSVREFVRALAKSELYRSRFFDNCYRYRAIELNFKHLLGRAPDNFDEMRYHSGVLDQTGFEADIDTYIDSDEYQNAFGENIVPFYRGIKTQPGQSMLEFTNMFQLLRSASSSDKDLTNQNQPQLTRAIIQNSPYGKLKASNVEEILAEVFKPKYDVLAQAQYSGTTPSTPAIDPALQQKVEEQSQVLAQLQKQLAELRPFAGIGANYLKSDWQSSGPVASEVSTDSLQEKADAQAAQIESLQAQVAEARSYATIGEVKLNKWRNRSFSR